MNLFLEGQKITLYFQKASNMVEMTCSIDKVMDDRLDLILPQYFMRYVEFLNVGNKVTAKAFSKFGTIDFNTIIISSPLEDTFTINPSYNDTMSYAAYNAENSSLSDKSFSLSANNSTCFSLGL